MSQYSFKLPDLGEGIVVSEIVEWHVQVGDQVTEDQHIVDVMTDKAVVEVTAPVSGIVAKLACDAGVEIPVGSELILFDTNAAQDDTGNQANPTGNSALEPTTPVTSTTPSAASSVVSAPPAFANTTNKHILTSPSVRKRARHSGIDLSLVSGSGKFGRINNEDLERFIASGGAQMSVISSGEQGTTEIKISGLRRAIAKKMLQSKRNIPHYSYVEEVDLTALETLRAHLNKNKQEQQSKLTLLPFIIKALNKVLADFPHCNAHYNEESQILTQHSNINVGIATMTELGLLVPVVKNSQALDIWQNAAELTRVTGVTKQGRAKSDELSGSTITITSLGAVGGIVTTPIINAPETCIIGINKMQQRAVIIDGKIEIRTMMNISSSFDHRIVDGYDGALLIQALKTMLENPGAIFV
ncbi:dihydrolipoamide acetyltransferase family protein [Gammaproteobacteria bacterium AS21]